MELILIPADPGEPTRVVTVPDERDGWYPAVKSLLDAESIERAAYDRDLMLWLDTYPPEPPNLRATRYAFGHSEAAAQNSRPTDAPPPYWLRGDIVAMGQDQDHEPTATVPARYHALFGAVRTGTQGGEQR